MPGSGVVLALLNVVTNAPTPGTGATAVIEAVGAGDLGARVIGPVVAVAAGIGHVILIVDHDFRSRSPLAGL